MVVYRMWSRISGVGYRSKESRRVYSIEFPRVTSQWSDGGARFLELTCRVIYGIGVQEFTDNCWEKKCKTPGSVEARVNGNANGNASVRVRVIGYSKLFREGSSDRSTIRAHQPIDVISQTLSTFRVILLKV